MVVPRRGAACSQRVAEACARGSPTDVKARERLRALDLDALGADGDLPVLEGLLLNGEKTKTAEPFAAKTRQVPHQGDARGAGRRLPSGSTS